MDIDQEARLALKTRLGPGARYDAPDAPGDQLRLARLGTAYFARKLNELDDEGLDRPSKVTGWRRSHVVADVGYQARWLARLVAAARSGSSVELIEEPEAQNEDVNFGATLPRHALRYLFAHSAVHLNVEWRELMSAGWKTAIASVDGEIVPIGATPWMRSIKVWLASVDLDNGASFFDFPPELLQRIIVERVKQLGAERKVATTLHVESAEATIVFGGGAALQLSGLRPDLAAWLSGRGSKGVSFSGKDFTPAIWPPIN